MIDSTSQPEQMLTYNVGQDLYSASVKDMQAWITLLKHDIVRLEAEIVKKQGERQAAESIFKKPE